MRTQWSSVFTIGLLCFCLAPRRTQAQYPPELQQQMWSAQWITHPDAPQRDAVVLRFRKVIDLPQKPAHFIVHVSADNQFQFYVNQQWVGFGPARADLAHWRYETYDIAPFLRGGKNVLAATVWNFGVLTPLSQISDRTAFILHGDTDAERAADTNDSWEVEQEKGIHALPTPEQVRRKYYVSEPAELMDGAILDWQWNMDSAPIRGWVKPQPLEYASLVGGALQNDNWQLVPDPLPAMQLQLAPAGSVVRTQGIETPFGFPSAPLAVPTHSKISILLDDSHLTTAYPALTVSGGRGATIRLTYAEALFSDKGEKGNRNDIAGKHIEGIFDEFIADGAANRTFMPLGWKTWRYLQLDIQTGADPLQLDKLQSFFTAYPFEERGYFHSDDPS